MQMFRYVLIILLCFSANTSRSQKRFQSEIFTTVDSVVDIQYGQAVNLKGQEEKLILDIITPPKADTMKHRPLLLFIHGGGFVDNTRKGAFSARLLETFARSGYVTATIDYRLGVDKTKGDVGYAEALYRAQQDGKAAIRFFKRYANKYGVDTSQIFIIGSSAGSMTCLGIAYMDEDEVPKEVDRTKWGTLEGASGNEGYSAKVQGVLNCWGSMIDYRWIEKGDAPLFNAAGTQDKTVPYDSSFAYHNFKYGPYILYQHCLQIGNPTAWRPFYGAGHTLDNNKAKQDSCLREMSAWLFTQLAINKGKNEEGVFRWENDIRMFDSLNKVEKHSSDAIMFLGSSYIRMWTNIRNDVKYKDIIHRGFGGCNLRDVAYYVKRIVYPHQPKALFIYVGNDIVDSDKDKTPLQVLELYKYVVKVVREKYPTIPITWLQISPSEKRWAVWDKVTEANNLVKAYTASEPNLYYIGSSDKFLGKDGKPITTLYRDDKLHYNEQGYKVWGNNIWKAVNKIAAGQ
jgi:lysophospholipase L1-like esterase